MKSWIKDGYKPWLAFLSNEYYKTVSQSLARMQMEPAALAGFGTLRAYCQQ
jgi:hypothetical protein